MLEGRKGRKIVNVTDRTTAFMFSYIRYGGTNRQFIIS